MNRLMRVAPSFFTLLVIMAFAAPGICETYEVLAPCFAKVSGWQQGKLDGMFMTMGGMKMLTGTMTYSRGNDNIDVIFNKGMAAGANWHGSFDEGMRLETPDTSMKIEKRKGFLVQMVDNKGDEHGSNVVVMLEKPEAGKSGSMLVFGSETVQLKELLPFAEKFDWGCFLNKAKSVW